MKLPSALTFAQSSPTDDKHHWWCGMGDILLVFVQACKVARATLNMLRNTFECTRKENVVKLNMHRQKRLEEEEEKRQDAQVHRADVSAFG